MLYLLNFSPSSLRLGRSQSGLGHITDRIHVILYSVILLITRHALHISPRTFNLIARKRSGIQGYPRDRHGHDRYLQSESAVLIPVSTRLHFPYQFGMFDPRLICSEFHSNTLDLLDRPRRAACYVYATFTCMSTRIRLIMIRGSIHVAIQRGRRGQGEIDRGCRVCHEAGPWGEGDTVSALSVFGNRKVQLTCHCSAPSTHSYRLASARTATTARSRTMTRRTTSRST
jgi:hypothetical protein